MSQPLAILIAGPTASGKSALAVRLAEHLDGEVINADSMQVYRDLAVLTARPDAADLARVPHRLYGHIDGAHACSAGQWAQEAAAAIAEAQARRRVPIVVGGTGLYFKALVEGLSDMPAVPAAVRDAVRRRAQPQASEDLHRELTRLDPQTAARLSRGDRQRIIRALEVLEASGRPLSSWQAGARRPLLDGERTVRVFVDPDRAVLRQRIDGRFAAMIAAGALAEVATLLTRDLPTDLPVMRAHGVPALSAHLRGVLSLADAMASAQADTRAYAKRQVTWFRHQMAGWTRVTPDDAERRSLERWRAMLARAS